MKATAAAVAIAPLVAAPAHAQDPDLQPDNSWISISEMAVSSTANWFVLDYGDGVTENYSSRS